MLVFEQQVEGVAGATLPRRLGQLDQAPVLGYVFPATLASEDISLGSTKGIVALAVTSHPDFSNQLQVDCPNHIAMTLD